MIYTFNFICYQQFTPCNGFSLNSPHQSDCLQRPQLIRIHSVAFISFFEKVGIIHYEWWLQSTKVAMNSVKRLFVLALIFAAWSKCIFNWSNCIDIKICMKWHCSIFFLVIADFNTRIILQGLTYLVPKGKWSFHCKVIHAKKTYFGIQIYANINASYLNAYSDLIKTGNEKFSFLMRLPLCFVLFDRSFR